MTDHELEVIDTIGTSEYLDFQMNVENGMNNYGFIAHVSDPST